MVGKGVLTLMLRDISAHCPTAGLLYRPWQSIRQAISLGQCAMTVWHHWSAAPFVNVHNMVPLITSDSQLDFHYAKLYQSCTGNIKMSWRRLLIPRLYSETRLLHTLKGNEKRYVLTKVHSIQNAIFLTDRAGSSCSRKRSATEDASPSWMSFITRFSYGEIAFQGIVNLKTFREIEIETEKFGWHACDQKRRTKERGKMLLEGTLVRNIRFICHVLYVLSEKKCTCFPIGDVRDRRWERYNRVYVLSRVRTNRVSL